MKKTLRDNKRWFIGLGIGVLAAVIFPQVVRIRFVWNLLSLILVWAIVGMGWNVIGGYCGQVSNGHSLFYGIGAYTVGLAVSYFKISPWISIWIGVGISMLIAFIVGKPLLRLKGHVFAYPPWLWRNVPESYSSTGNGAGAPPESIFIQKV